MFKVNVSLNFIQFITFHEVSEVISIVKYAVKGFILR